MLAAISLGLAAGCGPAGFASCRDAAEAGATPLHDGDQGWNPKLDRDGDGVACE